MSDNVEESLLRVDCSRPGVSATGHKRPVMPELQIAATHVKLAFCSL